MRLNRFLLTPNIDAGGTTTTPATETNPTGNGAARGEAFIQKHGSAAEAVDVLLSQAHTYRQAIADLKSKTPGEGSRVLSPDEAKSFDAWTSLGNLDDVRRKLREFPAIESKVKTYDREKEVGSALKAAKVSPDKADIVIPFLKDGETFEVKAEKVDGKDVETVYVKKADGTQAAFDDHFAKILPALRETPAEPERPVVTPRRGPLVVERNPNDGTVSPDARGEQQLRASGRYSISH